MAKYDYTILIGIFVLLHYSKTDMSLPNWPFFILRVSTAHYEWSNTHEPLNCNQNDNFYIVMLT